MLMRAVSMLLFRPISPLLHRSRVVIVGCSMAEASKKRRVLDKGAGVDLVQPKPQEERKLVCEEAAVVLQKCSQTKWHKTRHPATESDTMLDIGPGALRKKCKRDRCAPPGGRAGCKA